AADDLVYVALWLQLLERPFGFPQSDYLLLNLDDLRWGVNARFFYNAILAAIGRDGYEAIYAADDVVLLQRDAGPQPLTAAVLDRVQALLEGGGKFAPAAQETISYLGRQWVSEDLPETAVLLPARFEQGISLLGYNATADNAPGRPLCVTLYWQAEQALTKDYTVFLHLVAADGFVQAQHDSPPVFGYVPTSAWKPGEIAADLHCLAVPVSLPPGTYEVQAGLYDSATGERLAILAPGNVDNSLPLFSLRVPE
ncbi:MAG: hypothetical protein ACK2UK_15615, partial [Candidatus Promineifilaceae bacterium]